MKIKNISCVFSIAVWLLFFSLCFVRQSFSSPTKSALKQYYCTASDDASFDYLVNLIGSVHATNFDNLGEVAVFDLGLGWDQKELLNSMQKVHVYNFKLTHPDIIKHVVVGQYTLCGGTYGKVTRGWGAYKPCVLKQALDLFDYVLYLDPDSIVQKKIDHLFGYMNNVGHFFVQESEQEICGQKALLCLEAYCTKRVLRELKLDASENRWILQKPSMSTAVQGVSKYVFDSYVYPAYTCTRDLRNFEDDGSAPLDFGEGGREKLIFSVLAHKADLYFIEPDEYVQFEIDDKKKTFLVCDDLFDSDFSQKNVERKVTAYDAHIVYNMHNAYRMHNQSSYKLARYVDSIKFYDDRNNGRDLIELRSKFFPKKEKPITVVICSYNNKDWYKKNLDSVFNQRYDNYRVIYIDDVSPDKTGDLVGQYIKEKNQEHRVTLVKNTKRVGLLRNTYNGVYMCGDNDIVVTLDGDDWLSNEYVLARINHEYENENIWMTYGQFERWPGGEAGFCNYYPAAVIENNFFRHYDFLGIQLHTFYAWLFKKIQDQDFLYEGEFAPSCADFYYMVPMLEMAGTHSKFIPDVLYIYNRANPINDDKVNATLQWKCHVAAEQKFPYEPL